MVSFGWLILAWRQKCVQWLSSVWTTATKCRAGQFQGKESRFDSFDTGNTETPGVQVFSRISSFPSASTAATDAFRTSRQ